MKTPEEMAEEYCEDHDECEHARNAFLAGYHSRDEEMKKLREEIAMLKAELKEIGND